MASMKDVEQLADDLEGLVGDLRSELKNGQADFGKLIEIADQISERADGAAGMFATVNEALSGRISELTGGRSNGNSSRSRSSGSSRRTASSSSSK